MSTTIIIVLASLMSMLANITAATPAPTPTPAPTVHSTPAPTSRKTQTPATKAKQSDVELMAGIIEQEAGGESDRGQQAVGEVILNRVKSKRFPDTIWAVYSQPGQFSGFGEPLTPNAKTRRNAKLVLSGQTNILPDDVVYFSREPINKRVWGRIGRHLFCRI
jgi:spore germination cell wall hydrolase CwlJ-like protein